MPKTLRNIAFFVFLLILYRTNYATVEAVEVNHTFHLIGTTILEDNNFVILHWDCLGENFQDSMQYYLDIKGYTNVGDTFAFSVISCFVGLGFLSTIVVVLIIVFRKKNHK